MAKTINFKFEGKDYTLEFNRRTVERLERQGFNPNAATDTPMIMLPMLFSGAFLVHHANVKQEVIDRILEKMTDKTGLFAYLTQMYAEPIEALVEEPEDDEGNVTWGKS